MAPGNKGPLAILPGHAPLYTEIIAGELQIDDTKGTPKTFKVDGGVMRIRSNTVTIIVGF
jgi:F0F1-type ATP synthase epsilon subunit